MNRRLRDAFRGKASTQATDAAVSRGMADVLAALDTAVDDDTALSRIYTAAGTTVPGATPGQAAATPAGAPGTVPSRRRLALRSAAAVAAALSAAAVALAATGLPGTRRGGPERPAVNTAYVVKRVDRALDAAEPGAIAQMTITTRNTATTSGQSVTATAEEWSYADQWRAVTYTPAEHLLYDESLSTASVYTVVSYQTRTWARQTQTSSPAAQFADRPEPLPPRRELDGITEREREVLTLVGRGLSNAEIAASLFISAATAKAHVARLRAKLDARDRVQLVIAAYQAGLVPPSR